METTGSTNAVVLLNSASGAAAASPTVNERSSTRIPALAQIPRRTARVMKRCHEPEAVVESKLRGLLPFFVWGQAHALRGWGEHLRL